MACFQAASEFRLALIQLFVSPVKSDNLNRACKLVREAALQGARIVTLPDFVCQERHKELMDPEAFVIPVKNPGEGKSPSRIKECFNSPYGTKFFAEYAEKIPGESSKVLSDLAKECGIYLIGGSIPEEDAGKLYNTCAVFSPDGEMLVKHRKIHLFDIDVPGKICFKESETLNPGSSFSMFDTPYCKVGVGICYDMRFPELAQIYTKKGCQLLVYPGAFNMTTGPAHWELLQRSRALDNQVYVATASPARDENASYIAWGHSSVVNPWGEVIAKAGHEETVTYTDIDLQYLADVRQQIPVHNQKRSDLYSVEAKKE